MIMRDFKKFIVFVFQIDLDQIRNLDFIIDDQNFFDISVSLSGRGFLL